MAKRILIRIEAPHYVAGAIAELQENSNYKIIKAAPIISWMKGDFVNGIVDWCKEKGYKIETYEV